MPQIAVQTHKRRIAMPVFRTRINNTATVWERALVDVEAPDLETAINYVSELYDAGELTLNWKEYYSETDDTEVVAADDHDGDAGPPQVAVPAGWEAE
jgi:hypothetical protein